MDERNQHVGVTESSVNIPSTADVCLRVTSGICRVAIVASIRGLPFGIGAFLAPPQQGRQS